jgi:hypothetical protein
MQVGGTAQSLRVITEPSLRSRPLQARQLGAIWHLKYCRGTCAAARPGFVWAIVKRAIDQIATDTCDVGGSRK